MYKFVDITYLNQIIMKKLLLSLALVATSFGFSQVLQTENFNSLTIGNVGTDITGMTPGQASWLTFSTNGTAPTTSTNASNSNFQIVASGNTTSNGLLVQSPNGDKGSRFMWKDGLPTAWAARTSGNNLIEVEYDFFTGSATTSTAQSGVRLYGEDGTNSRVLCGYVYNSDTRILQGVAYLNNAGTFGTFLITLQTGGLILNANTWYRVGFGYNTISGMPYWKFNTNPSVSVNQANYAGPFAPSEVDFVVGVPASNTVSSNMTFDNYLVRASNADALLSIEDQNLISSALTVYPNPTKDRFQVDTNNSGMIELVSITDINGRVVKSINFSGVSNATVDVSDLISGMYFVVVQTDNGSGTTKFIKN